ncbi:hypothetical protein [Thalassovita aquimarina]|uniref:hypothetical protein n=1 Tax=Thalassovita aquimarina TaxID=2785917 RepID=UPI00356B57BD
MNTGDKAVWEAEIPGAIRARGCFAGNSRRMTTGYFKHLFLSSLWLYNRIEALPFQLGRKCRENF